MTTPSCRMPKSPWACSTASTRALANFSMLAVAKMDEVEAGITPPKEASKYIFELIRNAKFTPAANHLGDPDWHYINAGAFVTSLKTLFWLFTTAPADIRDGFRNPPCRAVTVIGNVAYFKVCGFVTVTVS
jgi:hypothetical protein